MKTCRRVSLGVVLLVAAGVWAGDRRSPVNLQEPPRSKAPDLAAVAVGPLVEALKDEDPIVTQHVENALVCLGARAVPALVEALDHADKAVRFKAATVLGRLGATPKAADVLPAVLKALKDKDVEVRRAAALAVGQVLGSAGVSAVPPSPYYAPPPTLSYPPPPQACPTAATYAP